MAVWLDNRYCEHVLSVKKVKSYNSFLVWILSATINSNQYKKAGKLLCDSPIHWSAKFLGNGKKPSNTRAMQVMDIIDT